MFKVIKHIARLLAIFIMIILAAILLIPTGLMHYLGKLLMYPYQFLSMWVSIVEGKLLK